MRPANDKSQALRYLLLRNMWQIKEQIPKQAFKEITNSLRVTEKNDELLITWLKNGVKYEKKYGLNEFNFFVRGDKGIDSTDYSIDFNTNNNLAKSFVREAFNIKDIDYSSKKESLLLINPINLIIYFFTSFLLSTFVNGQFIISSLLLMILFTIELWHIKGKLFVPLIITGFLYDGLLFTPLIGALIFLLLQFLDPNKMLIRLRIFLSLFSFLFISTELLANKTIIFFNPWFFLIVGASISYFLLFWVFESHFRSFPLVFTFFPIGLFLDGYIILSLSNFILLAIIFLFDRIWAKTSLFLRNKSILIQNNTKSKDT